MIPIDVDLQDPIEVIPHLINKWQAGTEMVLAKRIDRSTDGHLKRKSAEWFYRLHNKISTPKIEENVGDFRLMSREIVENIKLLPERNLFMKGILSWVGGQTDVVEYARAERVAGNSKFNGWKLWNTALEGLQVFYFPFAYLDVYRSERFCPLLIYAMWMIIDKLMGKPCSPVILRL